jgi:Ca2+-binding EF-hand superfamily protein
MSFLNKLTKSPVATDLVAGQAFKLFDKDKSGFIEAHEAQACLQKVFALLGQKAPAQHMIQSAFSKVAGTDQKLDKAEFTKLVREVMKLSGMKAH